MQKPSTVHQIMFFLLFAVAVVYSQQVSSAPNTIKKSSMLTQNKTKQLDRTMNIKGITVLNNNALSIKPGYSIKVLSNHSFSLMKGKQTGTGTFECACQLGSGGCDVLVTPTSVSCATSTCSKSCYIMVTIPTKRKKYMACQSTIKGKRWHHERSI
jgi:hypothetical protein